MIARVLVCAVLVVVAGVVPAFAERVAVAPLSGSGASSFQEAVEGVVATRYDVVASVKYERVARKLEVRRVTDAEVARVASELGVVAVVGGEVKKRKGRRIVHVWVRSAEGEVLGTVEIKAKSSRLKGDEQRKLKRELLAVLDGLSKSDPEEPVAEPEEPEVEPEERVAEAPGDGEESTALRGEPDVEVQASVPVSRARMPAIELSAGFSVWSRNLAFTAEQGLDQVPQTYAGNPVPGARIDAAVYPLALLGSRSSLANLGIAAVFDRVLLLHSRFPYQDPATGLREEAELGSAQMHWGVGLQYRHQLGRIGLVGSVRFNKLGFTIDRGEAPPGVVVTVPDVDYTYLDPGVSVRVPVISELALAATGRALLVLGTGPMADADNYGSASVYGFDLDAGVEYAVATRMVVRAAARWMHVSYSFDGNGDASNQLDGNPATLDVPSARDRYLGGSVTAAYTF